MHMQKIPTPLRQRVKRARVSLLPFLIWIAAAVMSAKLWAAGPTTSTYFGLAHGEEVQVSAAVDGKLERIWVDLYQTVDVGEPVATVDDAGLEASIETARAELTRLAAETGAQRASIEAQEDAVRRAAAARHGQSVATFDLEYPAELRAFHSDETDLELAILATRLEITTSELAADRLEVRLRRAESLAPPGLVPLSEVEDLELRLGQELARAQGLRLLEAGQQAELEEARQRRAALEGSVELPPSETFADPLVEARLAGWRAAIAVQERRLEELAVRRAAYLLRAPVTGRVAALVASAGQYVLAGETVVVLMDAQAREVALWVPESSPTAPALGDRFLVARAVERGTNATAECIVHALSPRLEPLPQRFWRDARIAEYGRACLVRPVDALQLVPGERVVLDPLRPEPRP